MPLLASTGLRNKVLDTGSVKNVLANGRIHVYASTLANIPASADDAIVPANHTLLLTVYGDGVSTGLNLGTASGGAIGKAAGETWAGTVLASGNAAFFRYVGSADTGAASTTEPRYQGRVGVSGAELNISSLALTAGNTQAVNFASISLPG
ncbi:hypothetical protein [Acidovorax sp. RAC01]|mgnify:CR=1 FL=1|uniref:hypothetical protein n=1 Tax=Acidovorax sp. RAC01 TaxID=1842533 RepID=UPI00085857A3|nr:hypothetical protein [Acidovorax sp. RAC01]AOG22140.1 hypothetical protein BSY15_3738 [Acidovorax sp. RAC01]AOG23514.1 hypothetical protein BSY15_3816 [Acidovorax sp. RAC01]